MKIALRGSRSYLLFTLILIVVSVSLLFWIKEQSVLERSFILVIKVTYENRDNDVWFLKESDRTIGLFMNNSWQTAYLMSASCSIERIDRDLDENPVALLDIKRMLLPGEKVSYEVAYRLVYDRRYLPPISEAASGTLNDIPEDLKKKYCESTYLWQSNLSALKDEVQKIVGAEKRVLTILRLIIRWIASNILYSPAEFPRYPNETFSLGLGDCDDQSNLLIAFCCLLGIPAYLQLGCIYSPYYNRTSRLWSERLLIRQVKVSWHGWAMVYIPPWGWLPVDPTCVSSLILRVDQLNAITSSAVIQHYTFQYMNIVVTDYIAETRSLKKLVEPNEFYIYEESIMEEMRSQSYSQIKSLLIYDNYTRVITLQISKLSDKRLNKPCFTN